MLICSTPNRGLSWASLYVNQRKISLSAFLTCIYEKEKVPLLLPQSVSPSEIHFPLFSVPLFSLLAHTFGPSADERSGWKTWWRTGIAFLSIFFLSTFSFKERLLQKSIQDPGCSIQYKYGLDWRKKNGNKIIMSVAPFHISCVIPRKSPLIVLYCELKWKKRDPGWKWRIRRRRHQLGKVTVGLSNLAIFTA